jgi:hypothetical protein
MTPTEVIPFDLAAHEKAASRLAEGTNMSALQATAKSLQVTDEESNKECLDLRNACATIEKRITDYWAPLADMANKLHKAITGKRGQMIQPWSDLKAAFHSKSEKFILDQRAAKRREEAELARIEDQRKRELEKQAEALMSRGYVEEAKAKIQQAAVTDMPTLPDAVGKIAGSRIGETWKAEGFDLTTTMMSIVAGKTPLLWDNGKGDQEPILVYNQQVLNAIAKRSQGSLKLPGVKFVEGVRIGAAKLG